MSFFDKITRVEFRSTKQIRCPKKGECIRWHGGGMVQAEADFHVTKYEIFERVERPSRLGTLLVGALMDRLLPAFGHGFCIRLGVRDDRFRNDRPRLA